jgi:hypothetical protein
VSFEIAASSRHLPESQHTSAYVSIRQHTSAYVSVASNVSVVELLPAATCLVYETLSD